jgi:hypothetical protein
LDCGHDNGGLCGDGRRGLDLGGELSDGKQRESGEETKCEAIHGDLRDGRMN